MVGKRGTTIKFTEWLKKLDEQQKRLNDLALSEACETISVEGKIISITLGKDKYETIIDGQEHGARYLRPLYTNNKEEFDAMLESLTDSTNQVVQATETILTSISEKAIPQAVIQRMKGEKTSGEPADLVESMAQQKLEELIKLVGEELGVFKEPTTTLFDEFEISFDDAGSHIMYRRNLEVVSITWRSMSVINRRGIITLGTSNIEEAMYFLANYEFIKYRCMKLVEQLKAIK